MRKLLTAGIAGISAFVAVVFLSGYGYIFKALAINLKKGPFTPSMEETHKLQ
jgi:hypothetical protein